jgi:hypothetical protein
LAFEKTLEMNLAWLDQSTLYRFAEIEWSFLFRLAPGADHWYYVIKKYIITEEHPEEDSHYQFHEAVKVPNFKKPSKRELLDYQRYHNLPYAKITQLHGISSATISKYRNHIPVYFPTYRYWNEDMLVRWNILKKSFNIWNEQLIHMKEKYDPNE